MIRNWRTVALVIAWCAATGCRTYDLNAVRLDQAGPLANPQFPIRYAETQGFTLGQPKSITFLPDGSAVLYLRSGPRDPRHALFEFDVATGRERRIASGQGRLDAEAAELSPEELARRERMRQRARGITSFSISHDSRLVLVPLSGRLLLLDRSRESVRELEGNGGYALSPSFSPDSRYVAVVRDGAVFVHDLVSHEERQLTPNATETLTYGTSEFVAQEEMRRFEGYWWGPDSQRMVIQETDTAPVETLYIADAVQPATPPRAYPYPRAGTANADVRLFIQPVGGGEPVYIQWDRHTYPYVVNVRWSQHSPLTVLVQNRRQTEMVLYAVDPNTGETEELLTESDPAWINIDQDVPHWLSNGQAFLWTTERNGIWQLELRARNGALVRALTPPDFFYQGIITVSDDGREAVIYGSYNPLVRGVYSIFPDGGQDEAPYPLTQGDAYHTAIYSSGLQHHVHGMESLTHERPLTVYDAEGVAIGELPSNVAQARQPNVEITLVDEGPGFYAALIRPSYFDSGSERRYPVIESAYAGPLGNRVTLNPRSYLMDQWFAEQGFIVVRMDGRGTPNRGRDFERAIKGNLIDVALADHKTILRALDRRYSELDLDRLGVHGWSFGGYYAAMAVCREPALYKAAVAGAPVVDWHDYDTHYTERYLGLPHENERGYAASNVLTYAPNLRRPLLLIHGATDDNVYFAHSLKLSGTLYRTGIRHDFVPLINITHMVADPNVAARRTILTLRFLERHLFPR